MNRFHANHLIAVQHQPRHLGLEPHLTAMLQDGVTHILDDPRQFVSADVRMGIGKDGR